MKDTIIKKTKEYEKFKFFEFNREINEGLVKRLMKSIKEIGYIEAKPVLVDKDYGILDGQHRFTACMNLGIEINYSVIKGDSHKIVTNLNAEQVNWKLGDFVHSWAQHGISCYTKLEEYENKYHLGISNSVMILFSKTTDKSDITNIKAGKHFSLNPDYMKITEFLLYCKPILPYWKSSFFIKAVTRMFTMATEAQIEKVRRYIISLPQQATTANYLIAFENLANRGVTQKNRTSFKTSLN